jgi:hypothetical protein
MEENKTQAMIGRLEDLIPQGLKSLLACKDAVCMAAEADSENGFLKELHRRFWEAEVAVMQAHELLLRLQKVERNEPLL